MLPIGDHHNSLHNPPYPSKASSPLLPPDHDIDFWQAVTQAAERTGCEVLFEIPGALLNGNEGGDNGGSESRAAVLGSRNSPNSPRHGLLGDVFYVIYNSEDRIIRILNEVEVPDTVSAISYSYSRLLEYLAADQSVNIARAN